MGRAPDLGVIGTEVWSSGVGKDFRHITRDLSCWDWNRWGPKG